MHNCFTCHIGHWDSFYIQISCPLKCGDQSNISFNKTCNICKIKRMVTKFIPPWYVNNYDKNRYLEKLSKAAVYVIFDTAYLDNLQFSLFNNGIVAHSILFNEWNVLSEAPCSPPISPSPTSGAYA